MYEDQIGGSVVWYACLLVYYCPVRQRKRCSPGQAELEVPCPESKEYPRG
jgi:hypothetical protein